MKAAPKAYPRIAVSTDGTVILIRPLTQNTREWFDSNTIEPVWLGDSLAVDQDIADQIIGAVRDEGGEVVTS